MESFRVDTAGLVFRVDGVEPRRDGDGNPLLDRVSRLPKFAVHLSVRQPERVRPDQWTVTVVGEPGLTVDSIVSVSGLVAFPWEQNGRHGIALRAESITNGKASHASTPAGSASSASGSGKE